MPDDEVLRRLLALNQQRAALSGLGTAPGVSATTLTKRASRQRRA
ncbi:hypothetical protein [Ottowia sp.]